MINGRIVLIGIIVIIKLWPDNFSHRGRQQIREIIDARDETSELNGFTYSEISSKNQDLCKQSIAHAKLQREYNINDICRKHNINSSPNQILYYPLPWRELLNAIIGEYMDFT